MRGVRQITATGAAALAVAAALAASASAAAPAPPDTRASQFLALQEATQMESRYIDDALGTGLR